MANMLSPLSLKCSFPHFRVFSSPSRATASILTSGIFSTPPRATIKPLSTKSLNYYGLEEAVQLLKAQTASFLTAISSCWRIYTSLLMHPASMHIWTYSSVPAVIFESTQQASFLTVFFEWDKIVFIELINPASIATWVYESSPVTIFPIVLKHGMAIETCSCSKSLMIFYRRLN